MMGLKCKKPNTDVVGAAYDQNLLTVPAADNVVRLLPALNISDQELADAVDRLDRAAASL
jgi:acetylornithine/N-succinyldiaminopimelate aminotransferase